MAQKSAACVYFAAGKCANGMRCRFSHDTDEKASVKGPVCWFYLKNSCTAGRQCAFSHNVNAELKAKLLVTNSSGETMPAPGSYRTRCRFYDAGGCATGKTCPFLHIDDDESKPVKRSSKTSHTVKMHVLTPNRKRSADSTTIKTEGEANNEAQLSSPDDVELINAPYDHQHIHELSDFLSKEEELFYYGAPGDFSLGDVKQDTNIKPSYAEITTKHVVEADVIDDVDKSPVMPPKVCTYFVQGACRYEGSCFYSHSLETLPESLTEVEIAQEEANLSIPLECGICLENIMAKNERFGLLSGCTHPFCLSCVRNWRGTSDQSKQTLRQCPICRVETHFVIPSNRMITNSERKQKLIDAYLKNLQSIPCRHFDEGRARCPFGTSCFYGHRYPTGEEDSREVRTVVDEEGHYNVLRESRLDRFFSSLEL